MTKPGQLNWMQVGSYESVWNYVVRNEVWLNAFIKGNNIRIVREQNKVPGDQTLKQKLIRNNVELILLWHRRSIWSWQPSSKPMHLPKTLAALVGRIVLRKWIYRAYHTILRKSQFGNQNWPLQEKYPPDGYKAPKKMCFWGGVLPLLSNNMEIPRHHSETGILAHNNLHILTSDKHLRHCCLSQPLPPLHVCKKYKTCTQGLHSVALLHS